MRSRIVYSRFDGTRYFLDDREVTQEEYEAAQESHLEEALESGIPPGGQCTGWPYYSQALGVHKNQRQRAMEIAQEKGVSTYFDERGRMEVRDQAHRRKYNKAHGFRDNDGCYGDG